MLGLDLWSQARRAVGGETGPPRYWRDVFEVNPPVNNGSVVNGLATTEIEGRVASIIPGSGAWDRISTANLFHYEEATKALRGTAATSTSTAIYTQLAGSDGATVLARMWAVVGTPAGQGWHELSIAASAGLSNAYLCRFTIAGGIEFRRRIAGVSGSAVYSTTTTAPTLGTPYLYGFSWKLNGSGIPVIRAYRDGVEIATFEDSDASKITTPGFGGMSVATHARISEIWLTDGETSG